MTVKQRRNNIIASITLLSIMVASSSIVASIPDAEAAVSYPNVRTDWEAHVAGKGSKATINKKTTGLVIPGTYYWWAKTMTVSGVYADNIDEGGVGAGYARYIPLSSSTAQTQQIVWFWDQDAESQGYSFGTTLSGSSFTPYVEYTSNSCWDRVTADGNTSRCVTGLTWGHPHFAIMQSYSSNTMDGHFQTIKWDNGSVWDNFSTASFNTYCKDNDTDKKIDKVNNSINELKFGTSAAASDCTPSHDVSDSLPA